MTRERGRFGYINISKDCLCKHPGGRHEMQEPFACTSCDCREFVEPTVELRVENLERAVVAIIRTIEQPPVALRKLLEQLK